MNIVIFTPAIRSSAIGRMAAIVVRELLARGHEVHVVRAESEALQVHPTHDFGVECLPWMSPRVADVVAAADLVSHQIGNSFDYHEGNLHWLDSAPGLVSLHDFYLGHLFFGWACQHVEEAKRELVRWYGVGAGDAFFAHANDASFIDLTRDSMPMTEWIASRAIGVVTHSSWGVARVLDACAGPVWTLPLAYDAHGEASDRSARDPDADVAVLTVGHVNPNKRVDQVIQAIGSSELLRRRIVYRIVGRAEPSMQAHLSALAQSLDVRIVISGEVDDAVLEQAFSQADIVTCLRWPSLESASASAIEAMLHGKPTLVTDNAFYSELPDDCVVKIHMDDERNEIRTSLESLCTDVAGAHALGDRARVWARHMFTAAKYADGLEALASPFRRALWLKRGAEAISGYLRSWHGGMHWMGTPSLADVTDIIGTESHTSD
ncbi:glycosyltransferase family 4 protein [Luteibacter sp. PPL552]